MRDGVRNLREYCVTCGRVRREAGEGIVIAGLTLHEMSGDMQDWMMFFFFGRGGGGPAKGDLFAKVFGARNGSKGDEEEKGCRSGNN